MQVSIRLSDECGALLASRAAEQNMTPGQYAKAWLTDELTEPAAEKAAGELARLRQEVSELRAASRDDGPPSAGGGPSAEGSPVGRELALLLKEQRKELAALVSEIRDELLAFANEQRTELRFVRADFKDFMERFSRAIS